VDGSADDTTLALLLAPANHQGAPGPPAGPEAGAAGPGAGAS
jgi:hypothetical protein